jgi:hypothetical protein
MLTVDVGVMAKVDAWEKPKVDVVILPKAGTTG